MTAAATCAAYLQSSSTTSVSCELVLPAMHPTSTFCSSCSSHYPAACLSPGSCRGLAQVALAQGDTCQALHHYGELVSKALMGRGSAEHWAYAEYGWLLFKVSRVCD